MLMDFNQTIHALILRRSGLELLMDKFRQCLTELSAHDTIMVGYCSLTFLFTASDQIEAISVPVNS